MRDDDLDLDSAPSLDEIPEDERPPAAVVAEFEAALDKYEAELRAAFAGEHADGTSEGAKKAWDTRGRGADEHRWEGIEPSAAAPPAPPSELSPEKKRARLASAIRRNELSRARIAALAEDPRPRAFNDRFRGAEKYLVHQNTRPGEGPWRVTMLNAEGAPFGHVAAGTYKRVLEIAHEYGADLASEARIDAADLAELEARLDGTSEGARKAWETRRRGRARSPELLKRALATGGFTFNFDEEVFPTQGFVVSTNPQAEFAVRGDINEQILRDFLDENADEFKGDACVGAWHDVEKGKWYLDVVHVVKDREKAIALARQHNQEGVYDLARGETVITKAAHERRDDGSGRIFLRLDPKKLSPAQMLAQMRKLERALDLVHQDADRSEAARKAWETRKKGLGPQEEPKPGPAKHAASTPPGSLAAVSALQVPSPAQLKFAQSGKDMSGAGYKDIYEDASGQRWLFKAATVKGSGEPKPYAAEAQVAFSNIAREVRDHLPLGLATMKGPGGKPVLGTLQPMLKLSTPKNLNDTAPAELSEAEKLDVASEHVLDWLTSNHDTHPGNLLRTADGRVVGADKEQGWRYFPKDKLSVDYAPNTENYGEREPYYNGFWRSWADGSMKFDPHRLEATMAKVEAIPSEKYEGLIRPYARAVSKTFGRSQAQEDAFVKAAVKRKETIRTQFEEFLSGLQGKPFRLAHHDAAREDEGTHEGAVKGWEHRPRAVEEAEATGEEIKRALATPQVDENGALKVTTLPGKLRDFDFQKIGALDPEQYLRDHLELADWVMNLGPEDGEVIDQYAGGAFGWINHDLRYGADPNDANAPAFTEPTKKLTAILDRAPELPEDTVVWRGFDHDELRLDPAAYLAKHGNVFRDEAFLSTSVDAHVGAGFAFAAVPLGHGVLVRLKLPKGTRAAYITNYQTGEERVGGEQELLLQRAASFKVTGILRAKDGRSILLADYLGSAPNEPLAGGRPHSDALPAPRVAPAAGDRFVWKAADVTWLGTRLDEGTSEGALKAWDTRGRGAHEPLDPEQDPKPTFTLEEEAALAKNIAAGKVESPAAKEMRETIGWVRGEIATSEAVLANPGAHTEAEIAEATKDLAAGKSLLPKYEATLQRLIDDPLSVANEHPTVRDLRATLKTFYTAIADPNQPAWSKQQVIGQIAATQKKLNDMLAKYGVPPELVAIPSLGIDPDPVIGTEAKPNKLHLLQEETSTQQPPSGYKVLAINPETGKPYAFIESDPSASEIDPSLKHGAVPAKKPEPTTPSDTPPAPAPQVSAKAVAKLVAEKKAAYEGWAALSAGKKAALTKQWTKQAQDELAATGLPKPVHEAAVALTPGKKAALTLKMKKEAAAKGITIEQLKAEKAQEALKGLVGPEKYAHLAGGKLVEEQIPASFWTVAEHLGGEEDLSAYHKHAKNQAKLWRETLLSQQAEALTNYQGSEYSLFNDPLRSSKVDSYSAEQIRRLTAALATAPELKQDMYLWRAFDYSPLAKDPAAFLAKSGRMLYDQGFVSTSVSPEKARSFASGNAGSTVFMRIKVSKGQRTPYLNRHSYDDDSYEYEHLLQRDAIFKVNRIMKTSDGITILDVEYLGSAPVGLKQRGATFDAEGNVASESRSPFIWTAADIESGGVFFFHP